MGCIDSYTELQRAFNTINEHIVDARVDLGTEIFHFVSSLTPIVNVDLLIKNKKGETLIEPLESIQKVNCNTDTLTKLEITKCEMEARLLELKY